MDSNNLQSELEDTKHLVEILKRDISLIRDENYFLKANRNSTLDRLEKLNNEYLENRRSLRDLAKSKQQLHVYYIDMTKDRDHWRKLYFKLVEDE